MEASRTPKRIHSVSKALRILRELATADGLSLSELSQRMDSSPSTVHHLVQTLVADRFVGQDPRTRHYFLGPALLTIQSPSTARQSLVRTLRVPMTKCAVTTGFDVWAGQLQGDRVIYVAHVAGRNPVKVDLPLEIPHAAYCVSPGRMQLSELPRHEVLSIVGRHALRRYTELTCTDADEIMARIEQARVDGYSEVVGERIEGTRDIAVGVREPSGRFLATLSIGAATSVFGDDKRGVVIAALRDAAAEAEAALGVPGPATPGHP